MLYFNFNGNLLEEHHPITGPDSRALRYGDGLFETVKYKNGRIILLKEHLERLWNGMHILQFKIPTLFTPELIEHEISRLLKKNNHDTARIRLSVIRGNGGLYDTENHLPNYIIQSWQLAGNTGDLNENGLQLCIYTVAKKSIDSFSNLKHNNYLPYFMGALFAKEKLCNDAIILNNNNLICDTTIANIFIIKDQSVFTPALNEGCVAGVMRQFVIRQLGAAGYNLTETAITAEALLEADEIFLTNSIQNIRWVKTIDKKSYSNSIIKKIYELCRTNRDVFC